MVRETIRATAQTIPADYE